MANKLQIKRTTVTGRTPNTTSSGNSQYISTGELALNLTDGVLYSSDGTNLITVGSNVVNQKVTGTLTVNALSSNGSVGTTGQVLTSDGTKTYWSTVSASINTAAQYTWTNNQTFANTVLINNNKQLRFQTVNSAAGVYFIQQNDDNFVFYTTNTSYGARPIFSIYANSDTSALGFGSPVNFSGSVGTFNANGSVGTSGQVLTSNGTTVYWSSPGAASVNAAAQYTWTNTHTFQANVAFTGTNISLVSNVGSLYLGGSTDSNWRIGRNTGGTTKYYYTNNTLDIIAAGSNLEGVVIGQPGGNTYLETGYAGTFTKNPIYVGNSTVNVSINSTSFTGSANNTAYLGGTAAASYQLNSTLSANVATMTSNLATYIVANTGLVSNATGVYVNSTYIGTLSANNASYLGGTAAASYQLNSTLSANVATMTANLATYIVANTGLVSNATGVYVNSTYIGTLSANNASYLGGTAAASYQLNSTLAANVATMAANSATYILANTGLVSNSLGVFVNSSYIGTLSSNNASYLGGVAAASYVNTSGSYTITGVHTHNANLVMGTGSLIANGSAGSANQVLTSNGTTVYWANAATGGGGGASVTVSDTAPSSPSSGDLWYYSVTGDLYVYYVDVNSSQWVSTVSGSGLVSDANNASYLGGNPSSYYAPVNAPSFTGAVSLGSSIAVTGNASFSSNASFTKQVTLSNTVTIAGNVTFSNVVTFTSSSISANGSVGPQGYVLTSGGPSGNVFWSPLGGNMDFGLITGSTSGATNLDYGTIA